MRPYYAPSKFGKLGYNGSPQSKQTIGADKQDRARGRVSACRLWDQGSSGLNIRFLQVKLYLRETTVGDVIGLFVEQAPKIGDASDSRVLVRRRVMEHQSSFSQLREVV